MIIMKFNLDSPLGKAIRTLLLQVISIIFGLLVGAIAIKLSGRSVVDAYTALYNGAFVGRTSLELTILNAIPLVFTGLSIALGFRAGLFNIGAEGQLILGGIAATWVGTTLNVGPVFTTALALMAAAAAGLIWAFPAAWLRAKKGAHEVITTLMLSYIALHLMNFVRKNWLYDPQSTTESSITVNENAKLVLINKVLPFFELGNTRVHTGVLIAIGVVVVMWFFLYKTIWGFEVRIVGDNTSAASASGVSVSRTIILSLCLGGVLAGLGGGVQLLGLYHRISVDSFVGLGFTGFFIALLAQNQPLGMIPAAIFFGALRAGALNMQFQANVPMSLTEFLQGILILFIAVPVLGKSLKMFKAIPDESE